MSATVFGQTVPDADATRMIGAARTGVANDLATELAANTTFTDAVAASTSLSSRYAPLTTAVTGIVVPPASVAALTGATTWFAANYAVMHRFSLEHARVVRYVLVLCGIASGNVQAGVVRLSGDDHTTFTRVATTGTIAAPTAGNWRLDFGATTLDPGEYAIFFWADNTTVTVPNAANSAIQAARLSPGTAELASGVPASGTLANWGTRYIPGLVLEGDI